MLDFIWLLFAHYFGDFHLQSDWMANNKLEHHYVMFSHVMLWTGAISIALEYIGALSLMTMLLLFVTHLSADVSKCMIVEMNIMNEWKALYIDQAYHIFTLICAYTVRF